LDIVCAFSAKPFTVFLDGIFLGVRTADVVTVTGRTIEDHIAQGEAVVNINYLHPTKEEVNAICPRLSVCLLARLLKKAWMDLDAMLRVDRRRDMPASVAQLIDSVAVRAAWLR